MKVTYQGGGEYRAISESGRTIDLGIEDGRPKVLSVLPACRCSDCEECDCGAGEDVVQAMAKVADRHRERTSQSGLF